MNETVTEPKKTVLEKLSDRIVWILATLLLVVGIVLVVLVDEGTIPSGATAEIVTSLAEALMVTGATTIIVSFALSETARLEPMIGRIFKDQASRFPSLDDIDDRITANIKSELAEVIAPLGGSVEKLADELPGLANAFVLKREHIYPQSITMLHGLGSGEVRVLMTAEEDLSSPSGEDWISELSEWLKVDFDSRRLIRVIARRPQFADDMEQVKAQLLEPFRETNANQWVYTDPEFPLSVLLLGTRLAVFGFLPRTQANPAPRSRFQYAVVVTSEMLVRNLVTWFDDRYTKDEKGAATARVMTRGEIDEDVLCQLWQDGQPA